MNKQTFALLLFIASVTLKPVPVRVTIAPGSFDVDAGKMKYRSPYPFQSTKALKFVSVFYIHSQESFLFSKTLGATFSNLGSTSKKIPIQTATLTEDKRDDEVVYFTASIDIENANSDTLENLSVQSILKTADTLHIFVGELEYFSVLRISLDKHNLPFVSMKDEKFPISKQTFTEIREGARLIDIKFNLNNKDLRSSNFMWTSDRSGLAVVFVKPKEFNSFRFVKVPFESDFRIQCNLLEQNPPYILSYEKKKKSAYEFTFQSVSQELFSEEFVCGDVKSVDTISITKQSQNHITSVSKKLEREVMVVDPAVIESLRGTENKKNQRNKSFDYSVVVSRQPDRLDFQLSTRIDNRSVYFKIDQIDGKKILTLMTLDAGLNVVSKTFDLPEGKYQRIRPAFILASESKAELLDLKMVRSARMHMGLFKPKDYCNIFTKPFLVNPDFIETPYDDGVSDTGVFLKLTDETANLRKWDFIHYIDKDGYLKLVIFDAKRAGFLEINDNDLTLSYMTAYQYNRKEQRTKNTVPSISMAELPKKIEPKEVFQTNVSFFDANTAILAHTFLVDPSNPRLIFVNMNTATLKIAKKNLKCKVGTLKQGHFSVIFYPVGSFVEITYDDNQIDVLYKDQKYTTEMLGDGVKRGSASVIYKKRGECTVLRSLFMGRTVDSPNKNTVLVDVGSLSIKVSKTQIIGLNGKEPLVISLAGYYSDGMTEAQLKGLKFSDEGKKCQIPVERDLRFTINQMELSLSNPKRSKNYIAPLPRLQKVQMFNNYKFGQQEQTMFHCFETIKTNLLQGKTCVVLAGFINDLSQKYEEEFFGVGANFFNTPLITFTQKDDNFNFDFVHTKGVLETTVKYDMVTMVLGEMVLLEARLSKPNVYIKDHTKRFFKLNLHFFINEIEQIKASIDFPSTEGLSVEKFESQDREYKFQIDINTDSNYLTALSKILAGSRFAFAGEAFENQKGELTLVLYEQTLFATNRMINFALFVDQTFIFKAAKKSKFKDQILNKMNNPLIVKKILQEIEKTSGDSKKLTVASLDKNVPSANSVCVGEECVAAAVFEGREAGEYYLISKAGSLNKILASSEEIKITDLDVKENIRGFPAVEVAAERLVLV